MDILTIIGSGLLIAVLIVGALFVWAVIRMRLLYRRVGSFECTVTPIGKDAWRSGIAMFGAQYITWYPSMGLSRKPELSFSRQRLEVIDHHGEDSETHSLVAHISCNGKEMLWCMSEDSLSGLVSWMDAAPPAEEPTRM